AGAQVAAPGVLEEQRCAGQVGRPARDRQPRRIAAGVDDQPRHGSSRLAPGPGWAGKAAGARKPCRAQAASTAATAWSSPPAGPSPTTQPPNPPPVIRAPSAPASTRV